MNIFNSFESGKHRGKEVKNIFKGNFSGALKQGFEANMWNSMGSYHESRANRRQDRHNEREQALKREQEIKRRQEIVDNYKNNIKEVNFKNSNYKTTIENLTYEQITKLNNLGIPIEKLPYEDVPIDHKVKERLGHNPLYLGKLDDSITSIPGFGFLYPETHLEEDRNETSVFMDHYGDLYLNKYFGDFLFLEECEITESNNKSKSKSIQDHSCNSTIKKNSIKNIKHLLKNIRKSNSQNNIHKNIGKIKDKLNAIEENINKTTNKSVCGRDARIYIFKLKDKFDKSNIKSNTKKQTTKTKNQKEKINKQ